MRMDKTSAGTAGGSNLARRRRSVQDDLILSILHTAPHALSAYDIQDRTTAKGGRIAVAQIYRVLDRLVRSGQVRRVELLSAYVIEPEGKNALFVCTRCRKAIGLSVEALASQLADAVVGSGLTVERQVIELSGQCPQCLAAEQASKAAPFRQPGALLAERARQTGRRASGMPTLSSP